MLWCAGFCVCGAARGNRTEGGAAMVSRLSRLQVLSVLLTLVLVAPPLGGRLSARPAAPAASSQPSATPDALFGVACPRPSTCFAVGWDGMIVRTTNGGSTWRRQPSDILFLNGVACP